MLQMFATHDNELTRQVNVRLPVDVIAWMDAQPTAETLRRGGLPGHRTQIILALLRQAMAQGQGD